MHGPAYPAPAGGDGTAGAGRSAEYAGETVKAGKISGVARERATGGETSGGGGRRSEDRKAVLDKRKGRNAMSKTQQTAGEKPRIGEQEVRRAAELLKKYRQGKVNLQRALVLFKAYKKLVKTLLLHCVNHL